MRFVITALALLSPLIASAWAANGKPNIIFIMADDLGPGWVDYDGSNVKINTPNLERLAKSGMVFTMLESLDGAVGKVLDALAATGTRDNTRLARWPGHIKAGSVSDVLCHSNDLLPTICSAAGVPLPEDDRFDGTDLLPVLTGKADSIKRGTHFWQIDFYKAMQRLEPRPKPRATEIARKGKSKLLARNGEPVELFDIESDLSEERNLLSENSDIAGELKKDLQSWLAAPRRKYKNITD